MKSIKNIFSKLLLIVASLLVTSVITNFTVSKTKAAHGDSIKIEKLEDNANTAYFLDPAATSVSLSTAAATSFGEISSISTPPAGKLYLYSKTDGAIYTKDDAGTEIKMSSNNKKESEESLAKGPTLFEAISSFLNNLNLPLANAAVGDPVKIEKVEDNANTAYFLDPAATGVSLSLAGAISLSEMPSPSTPPTGKVYLYAKSDGAIYTKDDTGTETKLAAGTSGINTLLRTKYETSGSGIGSLSWNYDHQGGSIVLGFCNSGDHYYFDNSGQSVSFAGQSLTLLKNVRFASGNSDDKPRLCEWWYKQSVPAQFASFSVTFKNAHVAEFWSYAFSLENVAAVGNTGGGTRNDDHGAGYISYSIAGQKEGNLILSLQSNQKANWSETSGASTCPLRRTRRSSRARVRTARGSSMRWGSAGV